MTEWFSRYLEWRRVNGKRNLKILIPVSILIPVVFIGFQYSKVKRSIEQDPWMVEYNIKNAGPKGLGEALFSNDIRFAKIQILQKRRAKFEKDCDAGVPESCAAASALWRDPESGDVVADKANAFLFKSCDFGKKPEDCKEVARMLSDSSLSEKATANFLANCNAGSINHCLWGGYAIANSTKDVETTLRLYAKACELGSGGGCGRAAGILFRHPSVSNKDRIQEAKQYADSGCDKYNDDESCMVLGMELMEGKNLAPNFSLARDYFQKVCPLTGDKDGNAFVVIACTQLVALFGPSEAYPRGRLGGINIELTKAYAARGCEFAKHTDELSENELQKMACSLASKFN